MNQKIAIRKKNKQGKSVPCPSVAVAQHQRSLIAADESAGRYTSSVMRLVLVSMMFLLNVLHTTHGFAQESSSPLKGMSGNQINMQKPAVADLPYRPKDGDKLGYSREESIKRLSPEVRVFLDGVLRLYKEPGLFANRREMFRALGTESGVREPLPRSIPWNSVNDPFREYAKPLGVFAREIQRPRQRIQAVRRQALGDIPACPRQGLLGLA